MLIKVYENILLFTFESPIIYLGCGWRNQTQSVSLPVFRFLRLGPKGTENGVKVMIMGS